MSSATEHVLGRDGGTLRISAREDVAAAVLSMVEQVRRDLIVFFPVLDGRLFNGQALADALVGFATAHNRNRARFVVEDASSMVANNGRIVDVCRRLSSFVRARQVGPEHTGLSEWFVVADETGYVHQPHLERNEVRVDYHAPLEARFLRRRFEQMWERSAPVPGIQVVGL
jgi:hypothetical protein